MKWFRHSLMLLPCVWLAACGSGGGSRGTTADAADPVAAQGFRLKSGEGFDDDSAKIREKFGTGYRYGQSVQGQRFQGADRDRPELKRWQGRNADKKPFEHKSFWGDREYAKKVYGGDTDGSRFQKDSRFGGQGAREAGTKARDAGKGYATGEYATGAAREAGRKEVARPADAETDTRRKVFTEPEIIDWRDPRVLSVDQTRRMMGRE